jgi:DNA-binding protein HU-beta
MSEAAGAVSTVFDAIRDALANGQAVAIAGFGTFSVAHRKERKAVNPRDRSQVIMVPAHNAAKFKPAKALKDAL